MYGLVRGVSASTPPEGEAEKDWTRPYLSLSLRRRYRCQTDLIYIHSHGGLPAPVFMREVMVLTKHFFKKITALLFLTGFLPHIFAHLKFETLHGLSKKTVFPPGPLESLGCRLSASVANIWGRMDWFTVGPVQCLWCTRYE